MVSGYLVGQMIISLTVRRGAGPWILRHFTDAILEFLRTCCRLVLHKCTDMCLLVTAPTRQLLRNDSIDNERSPR